MDFYSIVVIAFGLAIDVFSVAAVIRSQKDYSLPFGMEVGQIL